MLKDKITASDLGIMGIYAVRFALTQDEYRAGDIRQTVRKYLPAMDVDALYLLYCVMTVQLSDTGRLRDNEKENQRWTDFYVELKESLEKKVEEATTGKGN